MPVLTLHDVSKTFRIPHEKRATVREHLLQFFRPVRYEQLHAVHDVSLSVNQGEFVGVVGKNGSGKSTLLKLMSKIYPPTTGIVEVAGTVSPFLELGVGFNAELTARDNVMLYGAVLGIPRKHLQQRFASIMQFAELERFVDMKLKNFSSGMWVRLAFAVAIEAQADLFLFDEVLAVGDRQFQQKCFEVFRRFKQEGKTVVYVSHDLGTVQEFCPRTIYMKEGRIAADGPTASVTAAYVTDTA